MVELNLSLMPVNGGACKSSSVTPPTDIVNVCTLLVVLVLVLVVV